MFIEVLETPNPVTLKFLLSDVIIQDGKSYSFKTKEEANVSPLALKLFEIENVAQVYLSGDFVSVSVVSQDNWAMVKPKVLAFITQFVSLDIPAVDNVAITETAKANYKADSEEEQKIIDDIVDIFEERIRPAVAMDGGDIVFREFKDGIVYISMQGACSGCPSSTITLKNGIENMLKYYVPQVTSVVNMDDL